MVCYKYSCVNTKIYNCKNYFLIILTTKKHTAFLLFLNKNTIIMENFKTKFLFLRKY